MPGSVGFGPNSDGNSVNITTDENGNVTVTISPRKQDGSGPDTAVPPSTALKGKGEVSGATPGPGEKTGTFEVRVGDPLYVQIECKPNCEVVISLYPNAQASGTALSTITFPGNTDLPKQILVALLKQAVIDGKPKPAAPPPKQPVRGSGQAGPKEKQSAPPKKAPKGPVIKKR